MVKQFGVNRIRINNIIDMIVIVSAPDRSYFRIQLMHINKTMFSNMSIFMNGNFVWIIYYLSKVDFYDPK